jgi:hypothetical protein
MRTYSASRTILAAVAFALAACSGGSNSGGGGTTGPTPVASVNVAAGVASINVGQTTTLTASTLSAAGTALTGRVVSWATSASTVAIVSTTGVVTGVSAGSATITAVSEGKAGSTIITVINPNSACNGVTPISMNVGDVRVLSATERTNLCVAAGASGSEYVLIPFVSDSFPTRHSVTVTSTNTVATTAGPSFSRNQAIGGGSPFALSTSADYKLNRTFERRLRLTEKRDLAPMMRMRGKPSTLPALLRASRAEARAQSQAQFSLNPNGPASKITGLAATPTVGTLIRLNSNGNVACDSASRQNAIGRVAAVSKSAIVIADTTSPAGGFSDADFASFATTFDTLIFPVDTANFGAPFDMDNNGRIVLFFTPAVNKLTPKGATYFIGGFFFSRDLFPVTATTQVPFACAGSNEGEMFYLPVVDPSKTINEQFAVKTAMQTQTIGTLIHEFQHLINASRRIYITDANDFEDVWLNEGMSHTAEELLYQRITGFTPKSDLNLATITATQARLDAVNTYQLQNLYRLSDYMAATETSSAYVQNDSLETRGGTWGLLRYAMDQSPGTQSQYLHSLVNSAFNGARNFDAVFAGAFPNTFAWTQAFNIALFTDNAGFTIDPKYTILSWNFRSILPQVNTNVFPLKTRALLGGAAQTLSMQGGSAGYLRFRINAGQTASVASSSAGATLPAVVTMTLIRTN